MSTKGVLCRRRLLHLGNFREKAKDWKSSRSIQATHVKSTRLSGQDTEASREILGE